MLFSKKTTVCFMFLPFSSLFLGIIVVSLSKEALWPRTKIDPAMYLEKLPLFLIYVLLSFIVGWSNTVASGNEIGNY